MDLLAKLNSDHTLTYDQRMALLSYVQSLPGSIQAQLSSALATASGAGIGFLIAKLLFNMGLKGTIVMSLLGGLVGSSFGGSSLPAFDPLKNSGFKDTFGRYY